MTSGHLTRKEWFALAGVFALALAARLVAMAVAFDPNLKFEKYFDLARRLIANGWAAKEAFAYAPGYVYFMAVFVGMGTSPGVICLVQIFLGSFTCVFIHLIARRLFDHRVALATGIMAAIYGPFLTYDIEFLSDSFGTFLYCAAALALLWALSQPGIVEFVSAGLLLGLRTVQRPNVLLLVPFVVLLVVFKFVRPYGVKRIIAWCAILLLGVFVPILPIAIQNYIVTKEFIPITDSGGYVFYCSNNHGSEGLRYNPPGLVAQQMQRDPGAEETYVDLMDDILSQRVASLVEGRTLSPKESSRFWFREGLKCIRSRGIGQFRILAKKAFYMFNAYRSHDTFPVLVKDEKLGCLIWFGMGIVAPFAFVGMVVTGREWRKLLLGYALVLTPFASMMIFYVASRFSLELGAALIPFAAAGMLWMVDHCRAGRVGRAVAPAIALLLLLIASHYRDALIVQQTRIHEIHRRLYEGEITRDNGRVHDAMIQFQSGIALAKYPGEASGCAQALADIYRRMGEAEKARELSAFTRGNLTPQMIRRLQSLGDDFEARFALGQHFLLIKEYDKAVDHLSRSVELDPYNSVARFFMAEALFSGKRVSPEKIVVEIRESLDYGLRFSPWAHRAYMLIARCCMAEADWQATVKALRRALAYAPNYGPAHALLANALFEVGEPDAAQGHARRARELGAAEELAPGLRSTR
ncbi:MAG: glycosyltransferase family 39 protein [Planctomycetota bacterium]